MPYLFTSESVSEGHPDKIADQISDAILDAFLAQDPKSRVACEVFCTTGLVVVGGEVKSNAYVDIHEVVRSTIRRIGYTKSEYKFDAESCGIIVTLHEQSEDISQGVDQSDNKLGAGDQGMMFGYATSETPEFMPMALQYAHNLVRELAHIRKHEPHLMPYLRPDSKSQVTIEYDDNGMPLRVHTIVLSTQHDRHLADGTELTSDLIKEDVRNILVPRVIPEHMLVNTRYCVNPTGNFVIGGPHGDSGLTGRKIIVDTYGGKGAHGGGAFSGKDPSKVDRSAAYAARHLAKNLVAAGVASEVLVQLSYAIGIAEPLSIYINTYGTCKIQMTDAQIAQKISSINDIVSFTPKAIIERFDLTKPIYSPTAAYGHMGRTSTEIQVELNYIESTETATQRTETRTRQQATVTLFPWERLDLVEPLRKAFGLA
jgi:S-adenosylmethionine synthetase